MKEIFVTVRIRDIENDLKIPCDIKPSELLNCISTAFKISLPQTARVQAEPAGRMLNNGFALSEQGVENGALLTVIL